VSGKGAPAAGSVDARGLSLAIVATRWHDEVTTALLDSAVRTAAECGVEEPTVVRGGQCLRDDGQLDRTGDAHDAVAALGLVLRGGTPHFEYVCDAVTYGLTRVSLDSHTPVGNGVLTCDTDDQARARSGLPGSSEDKGREAVLAALDTAVVLKRLRTGTYN
jgi:6,7-dimethyl-8-ribityllumazine synthase